MHVPETVVNQGAFNGAGDLHGKSTGQSEKKISTGLKLIFYGVGVLLVCIAALGNYLRNAWIARLGQITDKAARTIVHVVHPSRGTEAMSLELPGQTSPYTDAPIFA